jgi:hypothetical protein
MPWPSDDVEARRPLLTVLDADVAATVDELRRLSSKGFSKGLKRGWCFTPHPHDRVHPIRLTYVSLTLRARLKRVVIPTAYAP